MAKKKAAPAVTENTGAPVGAPVAAPVAAPTQTGEVVAGVMQAAKAAKEPKPPKPPKPVKPPVDSQNGITRPVAGSKTGRVWEIADELSAAAKAPASRKEVLAKAEAEGINPATATTQHGRWREYHGLVNKRPNALEKAEADPASVAPVTIASTAAAGVVGAIEPIG
jgi:hypothetical protein